MGQPQDNYSAQPHAVPYNDLPSDLPELSIVLPCLNEAETLEKCIHKALAGLRKTGVCGEIIVVDNGSEDGSKDIVRRNQAQLVLASPRGYGSALRTGIEAARGTYVLIADADDSYDLSAVDLFIEKLRAGHTLVMGTRIKGIIMPGAMPWLHRWIGNPILTALANLLFHTRLSDYHCGMRAFRRAEIQQLELSTSGMEFATEMIAKAALYKYSISEIPIVYYRDGRSRQPHLRTWPDGWRHLRFMLLLSPTWVFLYPGLFLVLGGIIGSVLVLPGPLYIGQIGLDVHTLLISGVSVILGSQLLTWWLFSRLYAASIKLLPYTPFLRSLIKGPSLAVGLAVGGLLILGGTIPVFMSFVLWAHVQFGALDYRIALRWLIPGLVLIAIGMQIAFASFVIALINSSMTWKLKPDNDSVK